MKEGIKNTEAVIVLLVASNAASIGSGNVEVSSYIVNSCHKRERQQAVDTFITTYADHFLFHMPFCYRLN